jgi:hypothetical protein
MNGTVRARMLWVAMESIETARGELAEALAHLGEIEDCHPQAAQLRGIDQRLDGLADELSTKIMEDPR